MNLLILGLQWGDEGKGKAIDSLADGYEVVARYQGGHNAGHTIYHKGKKVVLHLLPSGMLSPDIKNVIAKGVVVNPIQLIKEIENIHFLGLNSDNLFLSANAPIIFPFHQELDTFFEQSRYTKIGTTKRGIGLAYEDLIGRRALFIRDLIDKDNFYKKIKPLNEHYNTLSKAFGGKEIKIDDYFDEYVEAGKYLKKYIINTTYLLNEYMENGKKILFEGAQGVLLDINHGTYPFVTSSNPTVGGLFSGTGLSHKVMGEVTGICKAYTTRVGEGSFPSELFGEEAELLREKGNEYGATTGRPRRVGWLDLVALKYAVMINGIDSIYLTKLDIFNDFEEIKLVTDYEIDGKITREFDPYPDVINSAKPVLKSFEGWKQNVSIIKKHEDFPKKAKEYLSFIEEYIGIPITYISVGKNRDETVKK